MKPTIRLLLVTFSLSIATLLNGCAEPPAGNHLLLKKGAVPEIVAVDGRVKLMPADFLERRLRLGNPSLETILVEDNRYMYITNKWFMDAVNWTEYFIKEQVPELDTLPELPTAYEETFTMLTSNIANLSVVKRYNIKASVLIGLVVANSDKPWGKIPADGKPRNYIIGLTEDGLIIYDIPTRQSIDGNDFPNKNSMTGIMF